MIGRVHDVSAFVLAGGKSTRMGRDKALLVLDGRTLLERVVELAREVTNQVWIVGDSEKYASFGAIIDDIYLERGPLGGIHAALTREGREWNLVFGVDLPFMSAKFLNWMVEEARKAKAVVTVPRVGGRFQPLSAVYQKGFAAAAKAALEAGNNKIDVLFREVKTRIIEENEIQQQGYSREMFQNVNTPEEWQRLVNRWSHVARQLRTKN